MTEDERIARLSPEKRKAFEALNPEEREVFWKLNSRVWRLSNLYWVTNKFGKKIKFRPNWAQKEFYNLFWFLNVVLKVRQIGISTWIGLLELDLCLHKKDYTCGLVDKTLDDGKKKLERIQYAYDHLDDPDDPTTAPLGALIKQAVGIKTSNKTEITFTNNSKIWVGSTLRGGTVNFLHVTELGPIAHNDPKRAAEIAKGAFNTVAAGNIIVTESTHEGGRYGLNYEMIRAAQATEGQKRTPLDWKLHFYPWPKEPTYTLALARPLILTRAQRHYFATLERQIPGLKLTEEQKNWWVTMSRRPGSDMAREYPGTIEEALQALTPGAIYGEVIGELRVAGRIRDFEPDQSTPLFTAWDIGVSDFCCIWLLQIIGYDILAVDYLTFSGERPAYYASKMVEWERQYRRPIVKHYLPHDAANVIKLAGDTPGGKSWLDMLREAGLFNVVKVPRTPDTWVGINYLRGILPRFFIHATNCSREVIKPDKTILPSGLACLEGYHKKVELIGGKQSELPVHDAASHGADALRTFAEAHAQRMIDKIIATQGGVPKKQKATQAITGLRTPIVVNERTDRLGVKTGQRARMGFRGA